jgi:ElaB/YqjD/DUF883 family membrane-anchored ribosome-binding protein
MPASGDGPRAIDVSASPEAQFAQGEAALAQSKVEVMAAFQYLINEGKLFLKSTAGVRSDAVQDATQRVGARLVDAKDQLSDWSQTTRTKGRDFAVAADEYVHEQPWLAAALVAGVAFMIAAVTMRR